MTFEEAKKTIKRHMDDIGNRIAEGDPLCTTIVLLLQVYLEEPGNGNVVGLLTKAVEEYRDTVVLGIGESCRHPAALH